MYLRITDKLISDMSMPVYVSNSIKCPLCDLKFATETQYRAHLDAELLIGERGFYPCFLCSYQVTKKNMLINHVIDSHMFQNKKKKFECSTCYKKFKDSKGMNYHTRYMPCLKPHHKCYKCNETFLTKSARDKHSRTICDGLDDKSITDHYRTVRTNLKHPRLIMPKLSDSSTCTQQSSEPDWLYHFDDLLDIDYSHLDFLKEIQIDEERFRASLKWTIT